MSLVSTLPGVAESPVNPEFASISTIELDTLVRSSYAADVDSGENTSSVGEQTISRRWVIVAMSIAAASFLLMHIADMNFCDPDLWHEMSLFRQALVEGWIPFEDRFAFSPTISPSVHHEWGSGAVFYAVMTTAGGPGLMLLKYSLVALVVAACYCCARMRGSSVDLFCVVVPAITLFSSYGFTTVRAQVFTLAMLSIMLCLLECDQRGRRWWIALWLPLHVLWLNLHAGFIVGSGLMAIHACEQIVRRRPFMHFIPIGLALAGLILVNPYGELYLPYLLHGLTMARPLIVEWQPLWEHDARVFSLFLLSLLPISLVAREVGVRKLVGLAVLAATAYAAFRHTRHLSLYCVVWACYVPGYLQMTRFGTRLEQFTREYGSSVVRICAVISIVCLARAIPAEPWKLKIPTTNQAVEAGLVCYPTAAIEHLKTTHFHGNVIVPFEVGGYVMWNLYPSAKVSIDGRYEVAYQPGVLEDHLKLYAAKPGWRDVLDQFAADAVLIPCLSRLSPAMTTVAGWKRIYHDGVYEIYTREHRVAYELLSDGRIQDFNSPQSSTTTVLAVLPD